MKKLLLLLTILPVFSFSQAIFQKQLSYENVLTISDIVPMADTGYMACGAITTPSYDTTWAVVVRFDSLMNVQWCRSYNMLEKDDFRCITFYNNNFYVGGTSRGEFSQSNGASINRISLAGSLLWQYRLPDSYDDAAIGIYKGLYNNVMIIVRHGVNGQPAKFLNLETTGVLLSAKKIETTNTPAGVLPNAATVDSSKNYYLAGRAYNATVNKWMGYILRYDGDVVDWYKEFDMGRDNSAFYGMAVLSDDNIVVTGSVADEDNPDNMNLCVMKVNASTGTEIWTKEIKQPDPFNQTGYKILALDNEQMLVTGQAGTLTGVQAFTAKLDADGNVIWAREYGDGPYEIMGKAVKAGNNRYLMLGKMAYDQGPYIVQSTADGVTPCLTSYLSFTAAEVVVDEYSPQTILSDVEIDPESPSVDTHWIDLDEEEICSGTVSIDETSARETVLVYPNPANGAFTVALKDNPKFPIMIKVHDMMGRCVYEEQISDQYSVIDANLSKGIYLVTILKLATHQEIGQQKVVIR